MKKHTKVTTKSAPTGIEWSKVHDFQFFMEISITLYNGRAEGPEWKTSESMMEHLRYLLFQRFNPKQLMYSQIIYKHDSWIEVYFDKYLHNEYQKPTSEFIDENGNVDEEAWGLQLMDAEFDKEWEPYFKVSFPAHENLYAAFSDSKLYKKLLRDAEKELNAKADDRRDNLAGFISEVRNLIRELSKTGNQPDSRSWYSALSTTLNMALKKSTAKHVSRYEPKSYVYLLVRMAQCCGFRPEKGQTFSQLVSDMLGLDFETADDYVKRACYEDMSQLWENDDTKIERIIRMHDMIQDCWLVDNVDAKYFKKTIVGDLPILTRPLAISDDRIIDRYYELVPQARKKNTNT